MSNSSAVQAARKKMQLSRLEQKGTAGYVSYYASQPLQVEKARKNADWKAALKSLRDANEAFAVAEITGEGLEAARETQAIAALVAERSKPARAGGPASATLSGA